MPITVFWLWCIHATWVADGTHQTLKESRLTFKNSFHRGNKSCIPEWKKLVLRVCCQEVTACFISSSVGNRLLASCFFRGPGRWKLLCPILLTGLVTSYSTVAGILWTTLHIDPYCALWFPCFWNPYQPFLPSFNLGPSKFSSFLLLCSSEMFHFSHRKLRRLNFFSFT